MTTGGQVAQLITRAKHRSTTLGHSVRRFRHTSPSKVEAFCHNPRCEDWVRVDSSGITPIRRLYGTAISFKCQYRRDQ